MSKVSRDYVQSLLNGLNQFETALDEERKARHESERLKALFGRALNALGVNRVNDDGTTEHRQCGTCGQVKARHDEKGRCPKYGPKSTEYTAKTEVATAQG